MLQAVPPTHKPAPRVHPTELLPSRGGEGQKHPPQNSHPSPQTPVFSPSAAGEAAAAFQC